MGVNHSLMNSHLFLGVNEVSLTKGVQNFMKVCFSRCNILLVCFYTAIMSFKVNLTLIMLKVSVDFLSSCKSSMLNMEQQISD